MMTTIRKAPRIGERGWVLQGNLRIKDVVFEVDMQRSEFLAYIPQPSPGQQSQGRLHWSLEIYCMESKHKSGFSPPCLYANELTFDVRDWRMIEGKVIQNEGDEGLAAFVGIDESFLTSNNLIRFVSRRENLFRVEWECLADVYWDDDYSSGLPLQLSTEMPFIGVCIWWINADEKGLATAKELVGRHFDLDCLQEPRIVKPYHILFPPRLNTNC
jgi:hypothetical protein